MTLLTAVENDNYYGFQYVALAFTGRDAKTNKSMLIFFGSGNLVDFQDAIGCTPDVPAVGYQGSHIGGLRSAAFFKGIYFFTE